MPRVEISHRVRAPLVPAAGSRLGVGHIQKVQHVIADVDALDDIARKPIAAGDDRRVVRSGAPFTVIELRNLVAGFLAEQPREPLVAGTPKLT